MFVNKKLVLSLALSAKSLTADIIEDHCCLKYQFIYEMVMIRPIINVF